MNWHPPISLALVPSDDSLSFKAMKPGETALPLPPHPGAFGVARAYHVHEGVDLYCAAGTPVQAVEAGTVVAIIPFTGPKAKSDWWHDTDAVLVEVRLHRFGGQRGVDGLVQPLRDVLGRLGRHDQALP